MMNEDPDFGKYVISPEIMCFATKVKNLRLIN